MNIPTPLHHHRNPKDRDSSGRSQAEHLQNLLPTARVVKAFNVLSAYTLSRGIRGSKEVRMRDLGGWERERGGDFKDRSINGKRGGGGRDWRRGRWKEREKGGSKTMIHSERSGGGGGLQK